MMALCEDLISHCCQMVNGDTKITYQGQAIDLTAPFARKTMNQACLLYTS